MPHELEHCMCVGLGSLLLCIPCCLEGGKSGISDLGKVEGWMGEQMFAWVSAFRGLAEGIDGCAI